MNADIDVQDLVGHLPHRASLALFVCKWNLPNIAFWGCKKPTYVEFNNFIITPFWIDQIPTKAMRDHEGLSSSCFRVLFFKQPPHSRALKFIVVHNFNGRESKPKIPFWEALPYYRLLKRLLGCSLRYHCFDP